MRNKLFYILLALIMNIILFELVISLFIYDYPKLRYDSDFGWVPCEDSTKTQGLEGYAHIRFNNLGLRGGNISPNVIGEKRILILGSSFTFAGEVPEDKTFVKLLQKKIEDAIPNHKINVINAGLPDASIANYYQLFPIYLEKVKPDLVVVQLVATDFWRAIKNEEGIGLRVEGNCDIKIIDKQEQTFKRKLIKNKLYRFLIDHSGFFSYFNIRIKLFTQSEMFYVKKVDELSKKSLQNQEKLMENTSELMDCVISRWSKNNIKVFILLIPGGNIYDNIYSSDREKILTEELLLTCKKCNVDVINMSKIFLSEYLSNKRLVKGFLNSIPGDGHLNINGHHLVAECLFEALRPRIVK
jgi:hypothetical protein